MPRVRTAAISALFLFVAAACISVVYAVPRQAAQGKESSPCVTVPAPSDFRGKWESAQGNGQSFFITLSADGVAWKSTGPGYGKWKWIDGEARIEWDDGWHDSIVKIGSGRRYLKLGYEPGKMFEGTPSNVGPANRVEPAR
jgi:hypothetical protein